MQNAWSPTGAGEEVARTTAQHASQGTHSDYRGWDASHSLDTTDANKRAIVVWDRRFCFARPPTPVFPALRVIRRFGATFPRYADTGKVYDVVDKSFGLHFIVQDTPTLNKCTTLWTRVPVYPPTHTSWAPAQFFQDTPTLNKCTTLWTRFSVNTLPLFQIRQHWKSVRRCGQRVSVTRPPTPFFPA